MFTILATCLGLMAIAAGSASAAETTAKYTVTGVSGKVTIYAGGTNGVVNCEKLTVAGQATESGTYPNQVRTGTITSITPTGCVYTFTNSPVELTLNSPWTFSYSVGKNTTTLSNFNLHAAWIGDPEVYFDMSGPTFTSGSPGFNFQKSLPLSVKSSNFATAVGMAKTGPGSIQGPIALSFKKVS